MTLAWNKVVPPEIVALVKRTLLKKDADHFYGRGDGLRGSSRHSAREKNNIRVLRKGSISADGNYFYDAVSKKRIKIERAIFEKFISFQYVSYFGGEIFDNIADKEHGFMLKLIPMLREIDPEQSSKKSLENRLKWLTYAHDEASGVSRNFVDPFFQKVVMNIDEKVKKHLNYY